MGIIPISFLVANSVANLVAMLIAVLVAQCEPRLLGSHCTKCASLSVEFDSVDYVMDCVKNISNVLKVHFTNADVFYITS